MSSKSIPKRVAEIVPHVAAVEVVGEDCLGRSVVQAVGVFGDFEGDAAGHRVLSELLTVRSAMGGKSVRPRDAGSHRPGCDGEIAVVRDACVAGRDMRGSGYKAESSENKVIKQKKKKELGFTGRGFYMRSNESVLSQV